MSANPQPPANLETLVERARGGDRQAIEDLLVSVQPQLYRFSMRMCRHEQDAEDVLQETMLTLSRKIGDFRGESSLSTWLYSVARSACIKKHRRGKFEPDPHAFEQVDQVADVASASPSPQDRIESGEIWQQVQDGIRALTPSHREVLVLRDVEGLSAREVADVIGITVPAVKSRLHRARGALRERMVGGAYHRREACPDIRRIFSQYLEGELSPRICDQMQAHVDECSECASECDGLKSALNACSNAPCEVPERVQLRVRAILSPDL